MTTRLPQRPKPPNKHQKHARKKAEHRTRRDEIERLLELSSSDDPEDRLIAAKNLCPCHVRTRIESVWRALYRMMKDSDVQVRRAAWHTLEDGGYPDDPAMDDILRQAMRDEKDPLIRQYMAPFAAARLKQEAMALAGAGRSAFTLRGRCDFCGQMEVRVKHDYETTIASDGQQRAALICEQCA